MPTRRHHVCTILPPHVLDSIARKGSDTQRGKALDTLHADHTLRSVRIQNTLLGRSKFIEPGIPAPNGEPKRTIYDVQGGEVLPGVLVRSEGGPDVKDVCVNEAYDGLGKTFKFFRDIFERDSIDDDGLPLDASVHYSQGYDNAFWDGQRMVFGDGDGELFKRFTISLDVIGHELAHGVTADEAGLVYQDQPGALNESMSDVFGSLVKQYALGQKAADADWLIGADLLADGVQGVALRSMKAPGTAYNDPVLGQDPQPATMAGYVEGPADNGGVHTNSGIPNHAFYQVATALGGYAWEKAGKIWYEALRDPRLRPTARFGTFARTTARAARRLYGEGSEEYGAVKEGWKVVGIDL